MRFLGLSLLVLTVGCNGDEDTDVVDSDVVIEDSGAADTDLDSDTDTDVDSDTDVDTDTDVDSDTDTDA